LEKYIIQAFFSLSNTLELEGTIKVANVLNNTVTSIESDYVLTKEGETPVLAPGQ
jgi:hypothetical protein